MGEKIIDVEQLIREKNPKLLKRLPGFVLRYLKKILHEDDVNDFLNKHQNDTPYDFSKAVMDKFNIKVHVKGLENIPKDKGAIVAMNHPWGGMDAMAFVTVVHPIRSDIKFVVNDVLLHLKGLNPLFVGVNKLGKNATESLRKVEEVFASEDLLCIFPAGLVSRRIKGKITDLEWKKTFITRAVKHEKLVIPTYIDGKLSNFFYNLYTIRTKLGIKGNIEMLYLVNELYKQYDKEITIHFGKPIPHETFDDTKKDKEWAEYVKNKVYQLKD